MSPWITIGLSAAGVALTTANGLTTRRLWASAAFDRPQKVAQTVLIWLLPGSVLLVGYILGESRRNPGADSTWSNDYSIAEDVAHHASSHHSGSGHSD